MENYLPNEELYSEFQRLKAENYHLKGQLKRKNNEAKGRDKYIRKLEKQLKQLKPDKQHYRNGKRGTVKNG